MPTWHKKRLRELGKTQNELAERLALDPAAISKIFHGSRSVKLSEAVTMATFLEVSLSTLCAELGLGPCAAGRQELIVRRQLTDGGKIQVMNDAQKIDLEIPSSIETGEPILCQTRDFEPRIFAGEILLREPVDLAEIDQYIGADCFLRCQDGCEHFGTLQRSSEPGRFYLLTYQRSMTEPVKPAALWRLAMILPRRFST